MPDRLTKALKETDKLLNGITYWLLGGLVLGIIREGDYLKNEHDLDLGIDEYSLPYLIQVLRKKYGNDVQVSSEAVNNNVVLRPVDNTDIVRVIKFEVEGIGVDIFVHFTKNEKYYLISKDNDAGYAYHVYPKKLYTNFKKIQFRGGEYLIPNPPEKYLTYEYGDWETPRSRWNHSLHPPCIKRSVDEIN